MPPEKRVVLASSGEERKLSLRVKARREGRVWSVTLPVFGMWSVRYTGQPGEAFDRVLERAADRAARLATEVGNGERWSPLCVVEEE